MHYIAQQLSAFRRKLKAELRHTPSYQRLRSLFFPFLFCITVTAEICASTLYYLFESNLPSGIHIATIGTVALIVTPLFGIALILIKTIENDQLEISQAKQKETAYSAEIQRHNYIFQSLLQMSISMQRSTKLETLLRNTLNDLYQMFPKCAFGIIIYGARQTTIKHFSSIQLLAEEETLIINEARKTSISNRLSSKLRLISQNTCDDDNQNVWRILPMLGQELKTIGHFIIKENDHDPLLDEVVRLLLEQLTTASENRLLLSEMERLANTDALTGIYNRNFFQQELAKEIVKAKQNNHIPFSILSIDINGLKRINDTFGHTQGDKLIIAVANLLKKTCRETDIITRSGGDEFTVLCPNTHCDDAMAVLNRIRAIEKTTTIAHYKGENTHQIEAVRISIGVACSTETSPDEVYALADANMYTDKKLFYVKHSQYR